MKSFRLDIIPILFRKRSRDVGFFSRPCWLFSSESEVFVFCFFFFFRAAPRSRTGAEIWQLLCIVLPAWAHKSLLYISCTDSECCSSDHDVWIRWVSGTGGVSDRSLTLSVFLSPVSRGDEFGINEYQPLMNQY